MKSKQTIRATANIMKNDISDWDKQHNQKKRLYLLAKRKGFALQLCRKGDVRDSEWRTFRILNRPSGEVVHSARPDGYGLTLDQVEQYLTQHSAKAQAGTKQTLIKRAATEDIPIVLKSSKPEGKPTVIQNASPAEAHPSTTPSVSRTPTLADRNVALLEAVAKNLEKAVEQYTAQLGICRDMIREAKNAR